MMAGRWFRLLAIAAGAAVFSSVAMAQVKVGIVNLNNAISETAEIKAENAKLEAKYRPRQQEIETLSKELQALQTKLQAGQNTLSQQAYQDLVADGQRKQRQLQRLQEDLQADFNRDRQDILDRIGREMLDVLQKLAAEKGLDVILDTSNALYYKPGLEITHDVTVAYDQAHPVAATATPPAAAPAK